jgi:putative DNA primase/helicase
MKHQNENPFTEASQLCKAIHHGDHTFDLVTFKRKPAAAGSTCEHGLYLPTGNYSGTLDDHAKYFPFFVKEGIEPFAMAACTDGQGVKNENVIHTWDLAIDFDDGYPSLLRWNRLVAPSLLVETSAGHFHAVWILKEPIYPDEAKAVLSAMAQRLGGDPAHAKVSQLVRLPGFLNQKRGFVPKLVETKAPKSPYKIEYLRQAFDVDFIVRATRTSIPRFNSHLEIKKDRSRPDDLDEVATDAESALEFLKDHAEEYSDWVRILMALLPLGDRGRQLAEKFSRASRKFDQTSFDKKWQEIQGHPGSVGTVFLLAQRNGWKNPGYRHISGSSVC